jgi:acyl-CoA synthetase (AMP-forming)/AMP-acid ligase II
MKRLPANVAEVFDHVLAVDPDRPALIGPRSGYSYAELDRAANRAANALASMGVRPGDRVGASMPNDVDVVVAFHGVMRLGAVWVGINRVLAPPEKHYILGDAGIKVFLGDDEMATQVEKLRGELPDLGPIVGDWAAAQRGADDGRLSPIIDPLAPAGIAYTSGTTGFPKGVVHSQYNLLLPGAATVASRGYDASLRKGDCLSFTILNLMVLSTLLVSQAGGCCVVMDRVDPTGIAAWLREEKVTVWNAVPAMLHGLIADPGVAADDLTSVNDLWTGGGDCPEVIRSRFADKFGIPIRSTYGLTEAPTLVTIDDRDGQHVAGASGKPLAHLDVGIVDEDGQAVPPGSTGEICIRPASAGPWAGQYRPMLGYWQRPEATDDTLRGGLLHTGDIGYLDGGYLFVRDRRSSLIIRGGANVYPAEVERVLQSAPGVVACAVVGIPDPRLGERVVAAVQLEPASEASSDDLRAYCHERLAAYKVPERFERVESLARNAMGKIQRTELHQLFVD